MKEIELEKVLRIFAAVKKEMSHGYTSQGEITAAILTYCVLTETPINVGIPQTNPAPRE
jgi:hypothetical protein